MSERLNPQYAQVEQPFGCEPPVVHCPICGKATINIGEEDIEVTPCYHMAFIYVGEVGEFEYTSQEFSMKMGGLGDIELGVDNFREYLEKAGYDNKLLAIEITYGGLSCGPNWYTDVYGFDYGTLSVDNES